MGPITYVGLVAQIGKRLFWTACPLFKNTETIAEINQKLSVTSPLNVWEYHDAAEVVFATVLLFTKVANDVIAICSSFAQNVKIKSI